MGVDSDSEVVWVLGISHLHIWHNELQFVVQLLHLQTGLVQRLVGLVPDVHLLFLLLLFEGLFFKPIQQHRGLFVDLVSGVATSAVYKHLVCLGFGEERLALDSRKVDGRCRNVHALDLVGHTVYFLYLCHRAFT